MPTASLQDRIQAALDLQQRGQLNGALAAFNAILADHPDQPDATHLLGLLLFQAGNPDAGAKLVARSLQLAPDNLGFRSNYVTLLQSQNKVDEALSQQSEIVRLNPNDADAHLRLGRMNIDLGNLSAAETALRRTLELSPDFHPALVALGRTLFLERAFDEAEAYLQRATVQDPNHAPSVVLLGNVRMAQGRLNEALSNHRRAVEIEPDNAISHYNFANALFLSKDISGAKTEYRRASALAPNLAEAHANLGTAMMMEGDFLGGWPHYEWRWKGDGFPNTQAPGPLWDGRPLPGETLLLTTEQGYGDAFQFGVFVAQAAQQSGARVVVQAQSEIADLMSSLPGVDHIVPRGAPLPPYAAQAPLMTLPLILQTTLDTITATGPYIHADTETCKKWKDEIAALPGRKVGLVWRGNPDQLRNVFRSCPAEALAPLLDIEGVTLVGLQKDPTDAELATLPTLVDFGRRVKTFGDTAAIMTHLDLVISVCTSTAHLAGALGRPLWVMLSTASDWRWFREREDSPWYPTARLFRQTELHDWRGVTERMAKALQNFPLH